MLAILLPGINLYAQDNLFNSSGNLKSPKDYWAGRKEAMENNRNNYSPSDRRQTESSSSLGSGGPAIHTPKSNVFKADNGKIGYADWQGKVLIPAIYDEMGEYSEQKEGSNQVWVKLNGKYGLLEYYQDKPVVPIKYDEMKKISILYVWVKLNGKVGVLSLRGGKTSTSRVAIPVKYDDMWLLGENLNLWVRMGNKYGVVDIFNDKILPVEYQDLIDYSARLIMVKKDNKWGLINNRGEVVLPVSFDKITLPVYNVSWVLQNGKWGLISDEGKVLATPQYDKLYRHKEGNTWLENRAIVSKQGKLIFINTRGEEDLSKPVSLPAGMREETTDKEVTANVQEQNTPVKTKSNTTSEPIENFNQGAINEFEPKDEQGFFTRGGTRFDKKDYRGAISDYNKAIELTPNDETIFSARGHAKDELEDYEGAIKDYDKAIELKPGFAIYYVNRGLSKLKANDKNNACIDLNKALELGYNDPTGAINRICNKDKTGEPANNKKLSETYFEKGNAKNKQKDYAGAILEYSKAIELSAEYSNYFYNRGTAKLNLEDNTGAIEDLNRAIELDPKDKSAFINRAMANTNIENYTGAISDFTKVVELDPKYVSGYYELGNLKRKFKDFAGAIEEYDKVVAIVPDDANTYLFRGIAKAKTKDYKGAIRDLTKALELNPELDEAYYNRGLVNLMDDNRPAACSDLKKAKGLGYSQVSSLINEYCK
ncbi:MAG: tetratricopeptide repeat protein [Bacteroidota bacterium]|nr:tetratricopeptide repeat protein [Bacteroidota bacterium]